MCWGLRWLPLSQRTQQAPVPATTHQKRLVCTHNYQSQYVHTQLSKSFTHTTHGSQYVHTHMEGLKGEAVPTRWCRHRGSVRAPV
jgi:hypothetical protein